METLTKCAICGSEALKTQQKINDYFLTNESFQLVQCETCGFLFINPRPEKNEIGRYYQAENYISHTDTNKGIVSKLYQKVKTINLVKKYKLITSYVKKGNILDIGCGVGDVLKFFSDKNWGVYGIEPDDSARQIAKEKTKAEINDESALLSIPDESFDVITMWHVLEHVHNIDERMNTIRHLIRPNGYFIFSVPMHESWDAEHYGNFWAAYDVPRHLSHFSQKTATMLVNRYGFDLIQTIPMKFDAYYISLLSEKYKTGKNGLIKAFINGLRSNFKAKSKNGNYSSLIFVCRPK